MRIISSCLLLCCVGLAIASPAPRKIEKKSIANSLAPKAIEPVDQKLDEPKLSDEALMEVAGENVDRAKKQASTTLCVEIRQNKPVQVDCDGLNNRPQQPLPPPPPAPPAPQEPAQPGPQVVPQVPQDFKFELPCEPEIGAYLVQPPGEIVYAPTGNCAQHVPAALHLPAGLPSVSVPGAVPASPAIQVLHVPGGVPSSLPGIGAGAGASIFSLPGGASGISLGGGASGISLAGGAPGISLGSGGSGISLGGGAPAPSLVHVVQPHIVSPAIHAIHAPHSLPVHSHGAHQVPGVECTCKSTQGAPAVGKSVDGSNPPPSNEALAMKFLQDLQRNANQHAAMSGSGSPMMMQLSPGGARQMNQPMQMSSPMMKMSHDSPMMSANPNGPAMAVSMPAMSAGSPMHMSGKSMDPSMQGRTYINLAPSPPSNVHQQVIYQQQGAGTYGYLVPSHFANAGAPGPMSASMRSQANCLEDSFQNAPTIQGLRTSRGPDEAEIKQQEQEQRKEKSDEAKKPSPAEMMEQMMKKSGANADSDAQDDPKVSRIARYLMSEKDAESNVVDNK